MSERITLFVDVILPIPLSQEFTYRVPFEMNDFIQEYLRVIVPFGKGKLYTGIITKIHQEAPRIYQAKYIEHILDEAPIITKKQFSFWKWMSEYYMAPIGDVMNAALPANFKLASETKIVIHPDFDSANTPLTDREYLVVEALEIKETLDLKEISEIIGIKTIQPLIKILLEKNIVLTLEEVSNKFSPKTGLFVVIHEDYRSDTVLNELFEQLAQKKTTQKQELVLLKILQLGGFHAGEVTPILRKSLEDQGCSLSAINTLEKQGVLRTERLEISRISSLDQSKFTFPVLSEAQTNAFQEIETSFQEKDTVLLQGITGSGKTEIYIELIRKVLDQGKQVLFLVPEIALTTQLIQRLSAYFGEKIGVYHSKFNSNERVEIWNKVLQNDPKQFRLVVGARSSIFLPFQDLGLVIVDEEHETSYKQHDPSPRYNARDMAIVLAHFFKTKVLLGSATPSIETFQNTRDKKYGHVLLTERFSQVQLPEILCADMKEERRQKSLNGHFSKFLLENIIETLKNQEQVILFQNRRGYTPIWTCEICGFSPNCINCDTTLNYHKHSNLLKCHHCSYQTNPIGTCPACGSNRLKMLGFGTEKIEDDLSLILPDIKIGRMDLDTTRNKNSHLELIQAFENREIDVLIGTQMVAKGLDFDHVGLVGILDADLMLNKTDFRAFERAFQLMTQVAGRSGRRNKRGKVIIQTGNPDHWVIQKVMEHDYDSFAINEIVERRNYHYPPFYKLIRFTLKHRDRDLVEAGALHFSKLLKEQFHERVLGPESPIIARIQNFYLKEIVLKIEHEAPQKKVKERLHELTDQFFSVPHFKPIRLVADVDPA
jgi:primosomal protein N' (replication factor Y)